MTELVVTLLVCIVGLLVVLLVRMNTVLEYQRGIYQTTQDLKRLSLNPRTRTTQASFQSGATSLEQGLTRLGRASAARRVVVGGDEDSQLYMDMARPNAAAAEREEDNG
jgi:hypothetical protein